MDFPTRASEDTPDPDAIIVKADEVDEAGADISAISPSNTSSESDFNARIENRRAADAQATGSPKILANAIPSPTRPISRPILRREGSAPAPPTQPPPPAPPRADAEKPTDSLSLQQLKKLVGELPKLEPAAYAYQYAETRSFAEELQEWFVYNEEERLMLLRAREDFEEKWTEMLAAGVSSNEEEISWIDAQEHDREAFLEEALRLLKEEEIGERVKGLESLSYICLGTWGETVGLDRLDDTNGEDTLAQAEDENRQLGSSPCHIEWIKKGVHFLIGCRALGLVKSILRNLWESEQQGGEPTDLSEESFAEFKLMQQLEANHALTIMYVVVEVCRSFGTHDTLSDVRRALEAEKPSFLLLLTQILAKSRWEDVSEPSCISRNKVLLLFWKSLMLLFGSSSDVVASKHALREASDTESGEDSEKLITTSPLDYHLFRQEITSKYPAYTPPPPLIPIEPENNTVLPPLPNHSSRQSSHDDLRCVTSNNSVGSSIFNKPVHIATPAPSPPPSPAGPGGKAAKKQNYQTNQNFPFLYPPLDEDSNDSVSNKYAQLQDSAVDRRWAGDNVPASIREAGQLFASRMRMSRSLRQLWEVRERYITEERGWGAMKDFDHEGDESASDVRNDDDEDEHSLVNSPECVEKRQLPDGTDVRKGLPRIQETDDEDIQTRLDAIDDYYRAALPDLQSLIIVLWKEMFSIVSALVATNGSNSGNGDEGSDPVARRRTNANSSASLNALANGHLSENDDVVDLAIENLNDIRTRELSAKAVSGILLIMLKWFKISHILKFEYLTQLLLDANYLPLVLKYFAHQNVDKAVEQKNDRHDLDFFAFCHHHSKHSAASPPQPALSPSSDSDSSDEAAPPPIRKHRHSSTLQSPPSTPPQPPMSRLPEVDELGLPAAGSILPKTPLQHFAPRFFLININLLRLLQKITKRKAHRALLMVQYKSSTILRKALKIPQPELRLYTLKLFKSQVPYCGRKWRQTNMRVITAIYLHCRPELRDEWLCGGDVDGVVEEAVPVEQAARSLVHWWHLREYRESMEGSIAQGSEKEEYDFFARELEKMGWGVGEIGSADGENGEAAADGGGAPEYEDGPVKMEGWH